jgi:adenylate cyclase
VADAHGVLGAALIFSGRAEDGLSSLETCIRLDPRSPRLSARLFHKAIAHYFCKDYEAAALVTAEVIRLYPRYPFPYRWRAAALGQLGRVHEGRRALEQAIAIAPEIFDRFVRKGVVWMNPDDRAHMVEGLRKAGLPD